MLQLEVAVRASREQRRPLPHVLFTGSAGCGKTTTARYIAELMGTSLLEIAPASAGDTTAFAKTLINSAKKFKRFPIVFIDETHHITVKDQEMLGLIMEDLKAPVKIGAIEKTNVKVPPFTLIGATTDAGRLLKPFRDRFKLVFSFKEYTEEEAIEIARYHSDKLGIHPDSYQLLKIVRCGRYTPRKIVSVLERYRDFLLVFSPASKVLPEDKFNAMLNVMGIRSEGLTDVDIVLLQTLEKQDSAIGIDALSMLINEGANTIRRTIEPYLMQKGFIQRTPRGRVLTDKGMQYLYNNGYATVDKDFNTQEFEFLE
jgi:Holliday junction DNA helicase RuvB